MFRFFRKPNGITLPTGSPTPDETKPPAYEPQLPPRDWELFARDDDLGYC